MLRFSHVRVSICCAALASAAGSVHALPTWSVDPSLSSLSLNSFSYADNGDNGFDPGPFDTDTLALTGWIPGFVGPVATHDFGNSANVISRDSVLQQSVTSASAVAEAFVDGDGTRTLSIRFRVNGLLDSFGTDAYFARFVANLSGAVRAQIVGATPGEQVQVEADWDWFANNKLADEGIGEEGPSMARGSMSISDPGGGANLLFNETFDSTLPGPMGGIGSGSATGVFTSGGSPLDFDIAFSSRAFSAMASPGNLPFNEDLEGAEFIGNLTLRIIPTPGAVSLLTIAGVFAARRRR